jgi:aryl-alcohol dehydrogenase-like predicted oxidoreductase
MALVRETAARKNATPAQISLAWMISKKPWIVPIPGTRRIDRLVENAGASDVALSAAEVAQLDDALDQLPVSEGYAVRR